MISNILVIHFFLISKFTQKAKLLQHFDCNTWVMLLNCSPGKLLHSLWLTLIGRPSGEKITSTETFN